MHFMFLALSMTASIVYADPTPLMTNVTFCPASYSGQKGDLDDIVASGDITPATVLKVIKMGGGKLESEANHLRNCITKTALPWVDKYVKSKTYTEFEAKFARERLRKILDMLNDETARKEMGLPPQKSDRGAAPATKMQ